MDASSTIRIGINFILQSIDVPKFRRRRMAVEQIVDAEPGAPPCRKCITCIKVHFSEALAVDLAERNGGIGARGGHARKVTHRGGSYARPRRERIISRDSEHSDPRSRNQNL